MNKPLDASFRDPDGFLFKADGVLYRQINQSYQQDYDTLLDSGLYDVLVKRNQLISHEEVTFENLNDDAYKVIKPVWLDMISYPYEWSFNQLKDAALLTLAIQKQALKKGMSLKDASAYNIQFHHGRPVFIDTLSFETYREGTPWVAYKQFCQHFLAPLALMSHVDITLNQLFKTNIDGVPLSLASRLLPWKTRFNLSLGVHVHMHAKTQEKYAADTESKKTINRSFSMHSFQALIDNLETSIKKLEWKASGTEWHDYYAENNNYSEEGLSAKKTLVSQFLDDSPQGMVWDLGANTGLFSEIAEQKGHSVVSWDIDPACVDMHYQWVKQKKLERLPLLIDLTNPSPAIGWANAERDAFASRCSIDAVLALGLIHHLAISNNTPLEKIAAFFADIAKVVVIEFVPKEDSQVKKLLSTREDIFPDYQEEGFEEAFSKYFSIAQKEAISGTCRTLYKLEALVA